MKRAFLLLSLLVPVVLLAVLLSVFVWLFETEGGLHWAYTQLQKRVSGTLEIRTLGGTLAGPIHIADLTYTSDGIDLQIQRAQITWAPTALLVGRFQLDTLAVDGVHVRTHKSQARQSDAREFGLPLNVSIGDVRIEHVSVDTSPGTSQTIDTIELAGFLGQEILRVDRLKVAAPNFFLEANGALGLKGATHHTLRVQWSAEPKPKLSIAGSGEIIGNLTHLTVNQKLKEPFAADIRAEILQPVADPQWQVHATFPEIDTRRLGWLERALQVGGTIDAHGGLVRYQASGTLRAKAPDLPVVAGAFTISGTTTADEVVVDQLTLNIPDTDMRLTAQSRWRPFDRAWTAEVQWQQLRWPITGAALLTSPKGTLEATGTHERYNGRFDFTTTANNYPSAHWRANAGGDRTNITFTDIAVDTLDATIAGTAQVAWSPRLRWRTEFSGSSLNPAVAWPDWPGSLALKATLSGDRDELRADVESLKGRLRDKRFAASASVVRRHDDYPNFALNVTAGDAKANISGTLERKWNLAWQVRVPNLTELTPNAAGNLISDGRVSGTRALPRIEAHASAEKLAYAGTQIRKASVEATIDLSDSTRSHVTLSAAQGTLFQREFESLAVNIDGLRSNHTIALDARWAQAALAVELQGGFADNLWTGSVTRSVARLGSESWSLAGQPRLVASADHIQLEQTCWRGGNTSACLTLNSKGGAPTTVAVSTRELPLALLAPLLPSPTEWHGTVSGDTRLQVDGGQLARADGRMEFSAGEVTLLDSARTVFAYDRGAIRLVIDDHGLHANADIALAGGDGGSAELLMSQFHSDIALDRQPISGHLSFAMRDLTPVAALLPQLEDLSGAIKMQFAATGTLADPRVRGEAVLTDGAARINATGIRVHDIRLAATADGSDELRLSGDAQAGPGRISLSGRVLFPDDRAWRAELHIGGENFQVADLRDNQIYVTPDLQVKLAPNEVVVDGTVQIPKATFTLHSQKGGVVETSPDVVLVNAPGDVPKPEPRWKIIAQVRVVLGDEVTFSGFGLTAKIAGDVALVEIPGQPATARGEVRVVKGKYDAYGQKLDVERGRLVFVGGPVTNPGIDARAVRKIEQITAGIEIRGTLQAPQLTLFSDPAMNQSDTLSYLLFGHPLEGANATEGRSLAAAALALRLTGGDALAQRIGSAFGIEEVGIESGTTGTTAATGTAATTGQSAALVLGKQLSPRLYINYSIGLFTPTNVLHLKYKLSQRWSLETQSGAQAGGDLIFSIEK
jgi:translocation and assembly module TamB